MEMTDSKDIESEVVEILSMEDQLQKLEARLSENSQFKKFIEFQRAVREKSAEVFKDIEDTMIENGIKSVKGEWGSITIVERTNYSGDLTQVPSRFIKKVLDTTKVSQSHKLEGKLPKGITTTTTKFLQKRFNKEQ